MRRRQSLAMGTQERGDAAVVTCPGKRRGGGQSLAVGGHAGERCGGSSQYSGGGGGGEEWGRGALGEKSGREEQDVAVNEGERRGHMKQNNYQHVM